MVGGPWIGFNMVSGSVVRGRCVGCQLLMVGGFVMRRSEKLDEDLFL